MFLILFSLQANPSEFTEMAWEGIVGAVDAARNSKQQVVETEHLMKSLLEQKDGLARRIFTKSGVDNTSVLQATDNFISQQPKVLILFPGNICTHMPVCMHAYNMSIYILFTGDG